MHQEQPEIQIELQGQTNQEQGLDAKDLNEKLGVILALQPDFITVQLNDTQDHTIVDALFLLQEALPITQIDKYVDLLIKLKNLIENEYFLLVEEQNDQGQPINEQIDKKKDENE